MEIKFATLLFFTIISANLSAGNDIRSRRGSPEGQLEIMDEDKDGNISSDEFYGTLEMFAELDSDSNGYIRLNELKYWDRKSEKKRDHSKRKRDPQKLLGRLDANKDGKVSKEEFRGQSEMFTKADTNKDGLLSIDELGNMPQQRGKRGSGGRGAGRGFGRGNF